MNRSRHHFPSVCVAILAAAISSSPALGQALPPLPGRLTFQGTNAYLDGQRTVFTGYGNYGALYSDYDYAAFLDELQQSGVNFTRQWVCPIPTDWGDQPRQPIVRRPDGTYDFSRLDPIFWKRFHRFLELAAARRIVVQITLWDRVSVARANYFAKNPLNTALGGWLPPVRGVGTPHFYADRDLREHQRAFTQAVVREIHMGGHWNVLLEVMNEPIAGSISQVEGWHQACYRWIRELSSNLPILINPVFRGDRLVPDPTDPRVDVVSYHGTQWADESNTAGRVADLIRRVARPTIADDDGLYAGVLSRDSNARVLALALGALAGGAIGFDHRDEEPANGGTIDRQALTALIHARTIHAGRRPLDEAGVVRRHRFPVAAEADYEVTGNGNGHIVFLADRTIRYRRLTASDPGSEVMVTPVDNRQGRYNLPRIGMVGDVPHLVFGIDSRPGNGLFLTSPGSRGWSRPSPLATTEQIEGFDAEGLDIVACTIAGSARSIHLRRRADGSFLQSDLFHGPDREPHLTSDGRTLYVASRFRFLRETEIEAPGPTRTRIDRRIQADSVGNPVRVVGQGGVSWVAWVGWTKVGPTTYHPSGVHCRDPQGRIRTLARFEATDVTSAQIDAVLDERGVLHLVHDENGVVYRSLVPLSGQPILSAVAHGQFPRIALSGPRRASIVFAGGLPGSATLNR